MSNESNAPAHANASKVFLFAIELFTRSRKSSKELNEPFLFLSITRSFIDSIPTFLIAPRAYFIPS